MLDEQAIVPQTIAMRLQEIAGRELANVGKLAVIVSSTIAKMQAERMTKNKARVFLSAQEAENWFAEKDA